MGSIQIEQRIPSCRINKTTIKKIITILEKEAEKIPEEDKKYSRPRIEITIKSSGKRITISDSSEFELQDIPRNLERIEIEYRWYESPEMKVDIDIGFRWWDLPTIIVSSNDSMWINGMIGQLKEIFEHEPTKHHIFHKNSTKYPIFIGMAILFGFAVHIAMPAEEPTVLSDGTELSNWLPTGFIAASTFSGMFFGVFLPWLFPIIEYEEEGVQRKIRKWMIILMMSVIASLFATGLYDQLKPQ